AANQTESQLIRIWEDVLRVSPIGLHQNYFDLGGHSLLAVRLFAQIEAVFKVKLPLATLIKAQTVSELARILEPNAPRPDWSSLVELQSGSSSPPFFCVHGGGGNVLI